MVHFPGAPKAAPIICWVVCSILKLRRRTFSWGDLAKIFYADDSETLAQVLNIDAESNLAPVAMDSQDNGRPLQEVCVDTIGENLYDGVPCINKEVLPRLIRAT